MITQMTVENFKAIWRVTVELGPFTVLIGPNDSGKSSFLEATYALAESTRSELSRCFLSPWENNELIHLQDDRQVTLAARVGFAPFKHGFPTDLTDAMGYCLELNFLATKQCRAASEWCYWLDQARGELKESRNQSFTSVFDLNRGRSFVTERDLLVQHVRDRLHPPTLARWDVEELAMPSRLPPERKYPFDPSGYGLSAAIAEMKLMRLDNFLAVQNGFCALFPGFKEIITIPRRNVQWVERDEHNQKRHTGNGDGFELALLHQDGYQLSAGLASGGMLMTLAFLTLIHWPKPSKLFLIEEPENGLHPSRLGEVVTMLRTLVKTNPGSQVIMTTHSPLLLDHVEPEEVRVFLRDDTYQVTVHDLAEVPGIKDRLKYMMLGELVYNEGESELIKEIRDHANTGAR